MVKHRPHIIIIGGGVIGTAIAYYLSRHEARVTLIEQGDLAAGSSGACDGLVFMQSKKPGIHLALAMESLKLFEMLKSELPMDIEFKKNGGMVVIESDAEYRAMVKFVSEQQKIGLDVGLLDREETLKKEPNLSPDVKGCTFSALDGQVNPINLTLGFGLGAKQNHAQILTHTKVLEIRAKNSRVTGVSTENGFFDADVVVNATGSMAGMISDTVGIDIPVKPRRGQIVVTHAARPIINHCILSAKYIAAKFDPSLAESAGQGISIEQADNGNLLLGSTREFVGFNRKNTISGIQKIISKTANLIPELKTCQIIRTFAGLRPYTPDGLPILGPVEEIDGLFIAAGHEGDGIALSPVTGNLMARMILEKPISFPLEDFSLNRFKNRQDQ